MQGLRKNARQSLARAAPGLMLWGLGVLAPGAYFLLFRAEWGASSAAAVVLPAAAGVLLAAFPRLGRAPEIPLLCAAAGSALAYTALLPRLGANATLALGAAALIVGASAAAKTARAGGPPPLTAAALAVCALGMAAAPAWLRLYALLIGHPLHAFSALLTAAFLGGALSLRLGARGAPALLAAGFLGTAGLSFLRFIGINAGQAERIQAALLGWGDLFFILAQAAFFFLLWTAACGASLAAAPGAGAWKKAAGPAALAAGAAAGWALLRRADPATVALIFNGALLALGAALVCARRFRHDPAVCALAAAVLAVGLGAGLRGRGLVKDIWTNRLNAVFPGGQFLTTQRGPDEELSVYRFASGHRIVLDDGFSPARPAESDKHFTHLALLSHEAPRKVLLIGLRSAVALRSAALHLAPLTLLDESPFLGEILSLSEEKPPPESPQAAFISETPGKFLQKSGEPFDVVIFDERLPPQNPRNALRLTRQALLQIKRRLSEGGVFALRSAPGTTPAMRARTRRTLQSVFGRVAACPALAPDELLLASDKDLGLDASKITTPLWLDDSTLDGFFRSGPPCSPLPAEPGQAVETDNLPRNAFVLLGAE